MQVALMIPCYLDLFYPEVGIAVLELLEKLDIDVVYPLDQTCCGQPMANSGCFEEAQATEELFIRNFTAARDSPEHPLGEVQLQSSVAYQLFRDSRPRDGVRSELVHDRKFSKPQKLLERIPGIQFVDFERPDECCGFGGTAAKMGYDKIDFIGKSGADYIVSSDNRGNGDAVRLGARLKHFKKGFTLYMMKAILNGPGSEIVELAKTNILR
jgi:L-lactate dehydrogenase complex protein LldE